VRDLRGRRRLRLTGSLRLCDDSPGKLVLRTTQRTTLRGRVRASSTFVRLVEPTANGCVRLGFHSSLKGRLAGRGLYVLELRARDSDGAVGAFRASRRIRR
jgi:hypothetical protein